MPIYRDITRAETLPASFYTDRETWDAVRERIFGRTWQFIGHVGSLFGSDNNLHPFSLHDGYLNDPLLLTRGTDGSVRCLSNVCTHRGHLLADGPQRVKKLVCPYHGRRFSLDGRMEFMPEFREAADFPRDGDHLPSLRTEQWRGFVFTGYSPSGSFKDMFSQLDPFLDFLPVESFQFRPGMSKTYQVQAHWALYCDNFLEGFHIPFVHETLGGMLDYGKYTTDVLDHAVLQTGFSDGNTPVFDLPEGHPDAGRNVTAYYYWIFPNLMFNFYPWGLQVNVVHPVDRRSCRVAFYYYLYDESLFREMEAQRVADITQEEDEAVVASVQKGLQSRFYTTGRFSPKREKGVHYFHRLIGQYLEEKK